MRGQLRLAFDETLRNLTSTWQRTIVLAAISLSVGFIVAILTITDVDRVAAVTKQQYDAGSSSFQVVGPGGSRVDALRCQSLEHIDGVIAAGGILHTETVRVTEQPDAEVHLLTVSSGFAAAAWPSSVRARGASVLAGSAFADLSWRNGSDVVIHYSDGRNAIITIGAVASSRSILGLERSLLVVEPPSGAVDSCLVLTDPQYRMSVAQSLPGWFGTGTKVQDIFTRSELVADPQALMSGRISGFGWLAGGFTVAVIVVGSWLARRAEFALYRLLELREPALLTMLIVEVLFLAFVPIQIGFLLAIGSHSLQTLHASALLLDLIRFDSLIALIPIFGLRCIPKRAILKTLKGF